MWLELNNCQEQYLGQIIFDDIATLSDTIVKQNEPVVVFGLKWVILNDQNLNRRMAFSDHFLELYFRILK